MSITNINELNSYIAQKISEGETSIRLDIDLSTLAFLN